MSCGGVDKCFGKGIMNLIIWFYLALAVWPTAFAIYYTQIKEVFQLPTDRHLRNDSYFGYSITYDEYNKKLVISAPRENDIGEVYYCNIENRVCTPIVNDIKRVSPQYTHDYWFGATVKAGRDFVLMCAPRYTEQINWPRRYDKYLTKGRCYSYANSTMTLERTIEDYEKTERPGLLMEKTMDSFGWSIDVTPNSSVIVGGPGMHHGRAIIYQPGNGVPKLIPTKAEFNFGYAVASGMFIGNSLSYAVSSPYGTSGHGEVAFYNGMYSLNFIVKLKEDSSQVGSLFGAVLCAARLVGNRTDLLVGAPTYAVNKTYNLGAVYVYLAVRLKKAPSFHRRIVGEVSGSMFGNAIVNVGDLNGDKKDEIAVGAPFEKEGHGIVYLYSGADLSSELSERKLKYLQRIEPEASYGESFGMSLTPLLDFDENGCNELAIGSPFKDTVVLLRCMAAVIVETSVKFPNLQGRTSSNKTDFEFEVCLSVKYPRIPQKIIALLLTSVEMDHDYAMLANTKDTGRFTYMTSLNEKKPKYCNNVSFILPLDGKYESKISYTVATKLLNDPGTLPVFNSSRVILNDLSVLTIQGLLWAAECAGAGNETCVPNLTLKPYISFDRGDDSYIIGSSKTETMSFTVHNDEEGEVAYDPCVRMRVIGSNVLTTPSSCVHENLAAGNIIKCKPPKPIRTNKTWTTDQIVLEMAHLTNLDRTIVISMLLFDRCGDVLTKNITKTISVMPDPHGITIKGETDIGTIVDVTKEDIEKNDKKMQHVYTITNKGPTNWKKLRVQVILQTKPYIKYGETPVTVYFSTSSLYAPCPFVRQNETSKTYLCVVESLMKKVEFAKILIPIYIVPGNLDGILDKDKNITIMSSVNLELIDDDYKVESITTTIRRMLQDSTVPIDTIVIVVIIIAVIIGICIVVIIVLFLYWVGFLRRKEKQALKNLKISVEHQAILRKSMKLQAGAGYDRRPILDYQDVLGRHKNS